MNTDSNNNFYYNAQKKLKYIKNQFSNNIDSSIQLKNIKNAIKDKIFNFEYKYHQMNKFMSYKKQKSLNTYYDIKFTIKEKYTKYKEIKNYKNIIRRRAIIIIGSSYFLTMSFLMYKITYKKEYKLKFSTILIGCSIIFLAIHFLIQNFINNYYYIKINKFINEITKEEKALNDK